MDPLVVALGEILDPLRLSFLFTGVVIGLIIGVVPGLGGLFALAVLIPFTYALDPYTAIALLLGMAAVTTTSDTIPAVLLGVPGTVGAMPTVLDGHALARQNQAARALGAAYSASLFGGLFGALVLALSIPIMGYVVQYLRTPDFLAAGILGLGFVAFLVGGSVLKGLAAALFGMMVSFVGLEAHTGLPRWTFGQLYLWEGLPLAAVFLGLFGLPELAAVLRRGQIVDHSAPLDAHGMRQGIADTFREWRLVFQCSGAAAALGALPGLGLSVIGWIAYGIAAGKRNGQPSYGEGNIRGVIGPESAANATEGATLIPTLALGVPGSAPMALLLGAFVVQGMVPGPKMLTDNASIIVAMVICIALANIAGTLICLALTNQLARITQVPATTIVPVALGFICLGAFQISASLGDLLVMLAFGAVGMVMKAQEWPRPAFALGFVLAPILERSFFLTYQISGWGWLARPSVVLVFLILGAILVRKLYHRHDVEQPSPARNSETPWRELDVILGALFAILAIAILVSSREFPIGASLFPNVTAVFLLLTSLLMLVVFGGLPRMRRRTDAKLDAVPPNRSERSQARLANLAIIGLASMTTAGIYLFGPLLTVFLLVGGMMRIFGKSRATTSLLTASGCAFVAWAIFYNLISIAWPQPLVLMMLAL